MTRRSHPADARRRRSGVCLLETASRPCWPDEYPQLSTFWAPWSRGRQRFGCLAPRLDRMVTGGVRMSAANLLCEERHLAFTSSPRNLRAGRRRRPQALWSYVPVLGSSRFYPACPGFFGLCLAWIRYRPGMKLVQRERFTALENIANAPAATPNRWEGWMIPRCARIRHNVGPCRGDNAAAVSPFSERPASFSQPPPSRHSFRDPGIALGR